MKNTKQGKRTCFLEVAYVVFRGCTESDKKPRILWNAGDKLVHPVNSVQLARPRPVRKTYEHLLEKT